MLAPDVSALPPALRPTGAWTLSLLHALAREETLGRSPLRLLEPERSTWNRFRGRLSLADFVALLFEDTAVVAPIPFGLRDDVAALPRDVVEAWVNALTALAPPTHGGPAADYIAEQARRLGLPTRLARSDLHTLKDHHQVLELPGTGGQLAHTLVTRQPELSLQSNVVIACANPAELTLAGLVALELRAPKGDFIVQASPSALRDPAHPLRTRSFDFVVGLSPEKGGALRAEDELAIWFPHAKILLV